ncbi:Na+/H+ antiporter subunit E [Haloarchaeobius amylolyticus]|uniref:Na+/H+ antiporter subunit E n=1 Tax=Haloarchaeobius amylolyticus TaxID=1198296 RepID=UPI00227183E4|nr:Na+/H+ antiporter subunit E [Haloarchaeobius amylolyticus]
MNPQSAAAATERPRRKAARYGTVAIVSFAFYLALGDPKDPFDLVTGVVSAAVVALVLGRIATERAPTAQTLRSFLRAAVFLPKLLWAVVRANLALAVVVLHPRLPIEPSLVRIPAPEGVFARALLANSITLTPGTVTVDIDGDELVVHTLTAASRAELLEGSLVRAVAAVTSDGSPHPEQAVRTDGGSDRNAGGKTG